MSASSSSPNAVAAAAERAGRPAAAGAPTVAVGGNRVRRNGPTSLLAARAGVAPSVGLSAARMGVRDAMRRAEERRIAQERREEWRKEAAAKAEAERAKAVAAIDRSRRMREEHSARLAEAAANSEGSKAGTGLGGVRGGLARLKALEEAVAEVEVEAAGGTARGSMVLNGRCADGQPEDRAYADESDSSGEQEQDRDREQDREQEQDSEQDSEQEAAHGALSVLVHSGVLGGATCGSGLLSPWLPIGSAETHLGDTLNGVGEDDDDLSPTEGEEMSEEALGMVEWDEVEEDEYLADELDDDHGEAARPVGWRVR